VHRRCPHGRARVAHERRSVARQNMKRKRKQPDPTSIADLRRRLLAVQARREEAKAALEEGRVVRVADVEHRWSLRVVQARTKILGAPSRIKQRLPHLTTRDLQVIDQVLREALEELADDAEGESSRRAPSRLAQAPAARAAGRPLDHVGRRPRPPAASR
jgi:phage terminase Nu1 subunit (DNA packaging protein)